MQSTVAIARDNKCACKITGLKHTRACNQREYRLRLKLKSLKQTTRVHEHYVNGSIQEVPVLFTDSVGLLCPVCGFHASKRGLEHVTSTLQALGIT